MRTWHGLAVAAMLFANAGCTDAGEPLAGQVGQEATCRDGTGDVRLATQLLEGSTVDGSDLRQVRTRVEDDQLWLAFHLSAPLPSVDGPDDSRHFQWTSGDWSVSGMLAADQDGWVVRLRDHAAQRQTPDEPDRWYTTVDDADARTPGARVVVTVPRESLPPAFAVSDTWQADLSSIRPLGVASDRCPDGVGATVAFPGNTPRDREPSSASPRTPMGTFEPVPSTESNRSAPPVTAMPTPTPPTATALNVTVTEFARQTGPPDFLDAVVGLLAAYNDDDQESAQAHATPEAISALWKQVSQPPPVPWQVSECSSSASLGQTWCRFHSSDGDVDATAHAVQDERYPAIGEIGAPAPSTGGP